MVSNRITEYVGNLRIFLRNIENNIRTRIKNMDSTSNEDEPPRYQDISGSSVTNQIQGTEDQNNVIQSQYGLTESYSVPNSYQNQDIKYVHTKICDSRNLTWWKWCCFSFWCNPCTWVYFGYRLKIGKWRLIIIIGLMFSCFIIGATMISLLVQYITALVLDVNNQIDKRDSYDDELTIDELFSIIGEAFGNHVQYGIALIVLLSVVMFMLAITSLCKCLTVQVYSKKYHGESDCMDSCCLSCYCQHCSGGNIGRDLERRYDDEEPLMTHQY